MSKDDVIKRYSAVVRGARHRQAPDQGSMMPSRRLRTPQRGSSVVAGRETRGGQGQTPRDRENTPGRGTRARQVSLPPLGFRPREGSVLAGLLALVEAGAPSDEMSRVSTAALTSARKCCFGSDWRQSRNRGEDLRASSQNPGSICSRRGQTPIVLDKCRLGAVSVPW